MADIFDSKRLAKAKNKSRSATKLYPSPFFAFGQGWDAACRYFKKMQSVEEICIGCGRYLYKSDEYFIFDEIGCFCKKCCKEIEEESLKR